MSNQDHLAEIWAKFPDVAEYFQKFPSLLKAILSDTDAESGDGREVRLLRYIYNHPALPSLRNNPAAILAAIDEFSNQDEFLINIGPDKGGKLVDIIEAAGARTYVELGGYVGYSAILVAERMRRYCAAAGAKPRLWSLEFDPLHAAVAGRMVELAGLSDVVTIEVGPADASAERLKKEGRLESVDVLFIDHVEERYVADFQKFEALGLLREGSVVVADNIVTPGAPEYREFARKHPGLESRAVKGRIVPGDREDEMEVSTVKKV